jgi:5-formyltetrahydrofolate cyclo-ligase
VLLYLPLPDEMSVTALRTSFPDKSFFVTRTPAAGGRLTIHPLDGPLETHPYGFEQPTATAPAVDPAGVELWLMPGLAFDRFGNRLGRGAGYFDELASRAPDSVRIGVSPAACVVERLPTEPHDLPVHHLATEEGVAPAAACG